MNIYQYLCVLFAFSAIIERLLPNEIRKILFFINGLVLLIVVGGRSCGTDYWLYQSVIEYGNIGEAAWPPIFAFAAEKLPFQVLIILVAGFTITPFYILIYKFANNLYNLAAAFFFTEYFFMTLMQQSRQGVALACMAWCFFFFNTPKIKSLLIIFCSTLVHVTGYFGFLPLFLRKSFYSIKMYIAAYGISLLMGGFVLDFLLQNVSALGMTFVTNKVFGYADRTVLLGASIPLFNFRFLLFFILFYYCYLKKDVLKNNMLPYLCNILFLGICFYTLFHSIVDLAVRGSSCFILLYFFIVLLLFGEKGIHKLQKNVIYWVSVSYCIYLMNQYMNMIKIQNSDLNLIPYTFM